MTIIRDEVGKKYNRLLVLNQEVSDHRGTVRWKCRCDCGKITIVRGTDLRLGITKSCGCLQKEKASKTGKQNLLPNYQATINAIIHDYKKRAKQKNLDFELSENQVRHLFQSDCFYCGSPPSSKRHCIGYGIFIRNGIDRVDNEKGYTTDNCVPCCWTCNRMKRDLTSDIFLKHIRLIYNYLFRKQ